MPSDPRGTILEAGKRIKSGKCELHSDSKEFG